MKEKTTEDSQLQLELDVFEGPLDLLLHLINQLEIDIYDIPIAHITEQYVNYLETMRMNQIDLAGEYFVMAATLMRIKSEMLVPRNENQAEIDEDDYLIDDPRQSLVDMLVEYQQIKEVVPKFEEQQMDRADLFGKEPADLSTYQEKIELTNQGLQIEDLSNVFQEVLENYRLNIPKARTIDSEEITVAEKMENILTELLDTPNKSLSFLSLAKTNDRKEIVVNFLAILELMKDNQVSVQQHSHKDDFFIVLK